MTNDYTGTQYLWFQDLILDLANNTLLEATPELLKRIGFKPKQQIQTRYHGIIPSILPAFAQPVKPHSFAKNLPKQELKWTPARFLEMYIAANQDAKTALLLTLALGLFSQHNFQGSLIITSDNNLAKMFLLTLFQKLYGKHFMITTPDNLTKTRLTNTTLFWLKLTPAMLKQRQQLLAQIANPFLIALPQTSNEVAALIKKQSKTAWPLYLLPKMTPKVASYNLQAKITAFANDPEALSWTVNQSLTILRQTNLSFNKPALTMSQLFNQLF